MKVYFISGLAADKRVFKHINLPTGYEPVYLDWIIPLKNETLESYALRLSEKIDTKENFSLVGLSMGGMIATEITKKLNPVTTILLSSVPSYKHFPVQFRIAYFLRLHKMMPMSVLKSASIMKRFFSDEDPQDKLIIKQVIKDSDTRFIRWAIDAILKWKNEDIPGNMYQIHGTNDLVLPIRYTKPTHIIHKAGHLMVMSKANDLNKIIGEVLFSG